ncbi:carbon storage regulator CsrA [Candidatus Parcubacteria bacterium]|nr:carbon storage regulator CsrA [Candidatus Parcubacteria bacterium]
MLVLSRERDQTITIGDEIEVTVVDIRGDKVRLGINAPKHVPVHRYEVYDAILREMQDMAAEARQTREIPIPFWIANRKPEELEDPLLWQSLTYFSLCRSIRHARQYVDIIKRRYGIPRDLARLTPEEVWGELRAAQKKGDIPRMEACVLELEQRGSRTQVASG